MSSGSGSSNGSNSNHYYKGDFKTQFKKKKNLKITPSVYREIEGIQGPTRKASEA